MRPVRWGLIVTALWACLGVLAWLALMEFCTSPVCWKPLAYPSMLIGALSAILGIERWFVPAVFRVRDGFPVLTTSGIVLTYFTPLAVACWRRRATKRNAVQ
jgi:hypothetical protein